MPSRIRTIVLCSLLALLALLANSIEGVLPMPLPAIRLGIANLFSLLALLLIGARAAFAVTLLRVFLALLLFGNVFAFTVSLPSSLIATLCAALLYKKKEFFSLPWISVASASLFNITQLAVVALLLKEPSVFYLLTPLLLIGSLSGWCIGYIAVRLQHRVITPHAHAQRKDLLDE